LLRLPAGVPAIIFGVIGLRRLNALPEHAGASVFWGRRLAVGGMVLGFVGCLLGVVGLVSLGLLRMREAASKTACANNLRQIGQAVVLHQKVLGFYPRAVVEQRPDPVVMLVPWLGEPYSSKLSWMAGILPFLERPMVTRKPGPFSPLFETL